MTQQIISVGSAANDGTGDPLRTAFQKSNGNFTELYARPTPASPAVAIPLTDATPGVVGTSTNYAREDHVHPTDTSRAPLASPTFTGTPAAPTATAGTNTTQLATTAFATGAVSTLSSSMTTADNLRVLKAGDTMTGALAITNTTASSTPTTGALTVAGGAGIAGAVYIGGGITATGAGGSGPTISSIDSRGGGATIAIGANFNGLGGPGLYSVGAFPLLFGTNTTLRMQLATSGDLQVLNTTASSSPTTGALTVAGGVGVSGNIYVGGGGYKPGGGPWTDSSDARIKTVLGDYSRGLAEVLQLTPRRYTFKGNDTKEPTTASKLPFERSPHFAVAKAGTEFIGLIAQEAEAAMPEMVSFAAGYIDGKTKVDDLRTLDTGALIYALVNAVKELAARVAALETGATQ